MKTAIEYSFIPTVKDLPKFSVGHEADEEAYMFIEEKVIPSLPLLLTKESVNINSAPDSDIVKSRVEIMLRSRGYGIKFGSTYADISPFKKENLLKRILLYKFDWNPKIQIYSAIMLVFLVFF